MATFYGFTAVFLWSLLALLTAASGMVPPFQLAALTFTIATLVGLVLCIIKKTPFSAFKQPLPVWIVGVGGLFGYHFFYFTALKNAPPVEASLIAYLWPLLIVLMAAMLPGERLRWFHLIGALMGLSGTALLVKRGTGLTFDTHYIIGYGAAFLSALIWALYSVLSRQFAKTPSDIVTAFCAATALLSALCHLAFETTKWPDTTTQWLALIGLGLGPVGLAFYTWDIGMKRGNIQLLGVGSYAAPLLSTLLLIAFGYGNFTWQVILACLLITSGALLAAKEIIAKKS
ncbi:MAG: EamA family transporter [Hyphomicrobiales bacterium]